MTVDEFMTLNPVGTGRWQLIDGEPKAMVPMSFAHRVLLAKLCRAFGNHLRAAGSPCQALPLVSVVPDANPRHNVRVPDLSVAHDLSEQEERWLTSPVLVVELLVPDNHVETWDNIWACASIPSVEELLVLHVEQVAADLLRRGADGHWPREPERLTEGDLVLHSIGLRVPLADLYGTARPQADAASQGASRMQPLP